VQRESPNFLPRHINNLLKMHTTQSSHRQKGSETEAITIRHPNGYGSVCKLSGNRRRPYLAKKTIGFNDKGHPVYQIIGYYAKREDALLALAEHNKNPLAIDNDKITFAEVFEIWKAKKYDGATPSTINGYNAAYKNSPSLHNMKFRDIKTMHMDKAIKECKLGHGSLRKMKILYQQLYAYSMANDIVTKDYSEYVKLPENKVKPTRTIFSKEEIDRLFSVASNVPFADSILVLIYTGLRPGELLNIRTADVNLNNRYFVVTASKTEAGENRPIPISAKIIDFIAARVAPGNEFLLSYKGKKITYDYYYRSIFEPIMEQLGMKHRPHDCRHTFATLMNNADANQTSIKNIIGHTTVAMSEKTYTHKDIEELRRAIDLI
jgi:integrase